MTRSPDVIVIGGGVIGVACAWRLARAGLGVRLLEAREVGSGASGASLGALMPASPLHRGPVQELQRRSLWGFARFCAELEEVSGERGLYERRGRLELLGDEKRRARAREEVEAAAREWPTVDGLSPQQLLEPAEVEELEPQVICGEQGALLCRATAQVPVVRLVAGLHRAAECAGAEIETGCEVESIAVADGRVEGVRLRGRLLPARTVLVAAGAHAARLSPLLESAAPIGPVKGQALTLRVAAPLFSRLLKSGSTYLLRRGETRALLGATTEKRAGFDVEPSPEAARTLLEAGRALVRGLDRAQVEEHRVGLRPAGPDRRPYLGAVPGAEGLFIAGGHFKIGIALTPITAEIITALITRGRSPIDLTPFAPGR